MTHDRDPEAEKRRDYAKQHRSLSGESRHAERRNRPRRRARTHRKLRREVRQVLAEPVETADPEAAERLTNGAAEAELPYFSIWSAASLEEFLEDRKRYRAQEAGRVFFREPYDSTRHRRAFARFLESVVQGGVAPSKELAERFDRYLHPTQPWQRSSFLEEFLADAPGWRARLENWIVKTLEHRPAGPRRP